MFQITGLNNLFNERCIDFITEENAKKWWSNDGFSTMISVIGSHVDKGASSRSPP
jgi:hypothetical protein